MKKRYVSWEQHTKLVNEILRQMAKDRWTPDIVVGISRGGLLPAKMISQYLEKPLEIVKISLRNEGICESNLALVEDALALKRILVVDDINDTGATLNWLKDDWESQKSFKWKSMWGFSVRVAVLFDNLASDSQLRVSYHGQEINKIDDPEWIVFPWEDWWRSN